MKARRLDIGKTPEQLAGTLHRLVEIPIPAGYFAVTALGHEGSVQGPNGTDLAPQALAKLIREHPNYQKGQPVVLSIADAGVNPVSFAQIVANELGADVYAPHCRLQMEYHGDQIPGALIYTRAITLTNENSDNEGRMEAIPRELLPIVEIREGGFMVYDYMAVRGRPAFGRFRPSFQIEPVGALPEAARPDTPAHP